MSQGRLLRRPDDLPSWFEPLLTRAGRSRTEDFTTLREPTASGSRSSAVLVLLADSAPATRTPSSADPGAPASRGSDLPGSASRGSDLLSPDSRGPDLRVPDLRGSGGPGPGLRGSGSSAPDLLVLQRAATMRNHAGQPAFPGGATDPGDADAPATALREASEEVGLDPSSAEVLAVLPDLWIPVSRFVVTPVLAWWRTPHEVHPLQPAEVAHVARLPVSELADPANRIRVRHPSGWIGPAFQAGGLLVWGFTAGVISALLDMAEWSVPWDQSRVVELPDAAAPVPAARGGAPDEVVP